MLKNISTATDFVDEWTHEWICHTASKVNEWYVDANTVHYQIFDSVPQYIIDTAKDNFSVYSTSIIKQNPGMTLPEHTDSYFKFKEQHGYRGDIERWCVFLQDWQPGHYFDMNGEPIVKWKKGDYVELEEGVPHRGSNSGKVPKYTAQITGVKK